MYQPFDLVRLVEAVPEAGLPPGTVGVILAVFSEPEPYYEVEVADSDGRTLYVGSLRPEQVEPV
jgi:hypothetical protein